MVAFLHLLNYFCLPRITPYTIKPAAPAKARYCLLRLESDRYISKPNLLGFLKASTKLFGFERSSFTLNCFCAFSIVLLFRIRFCLRQSDRYVIKNALKISTNALLTSFLIFILTYPPLNSVFASDSRIHRII